MVQGDGNEQSQQGSHYLMLKSKTNPPWFTLFSESDARIQKLRKMLLVVRKWTSSHEHSKRYEWLYIFFI